MRALKFLRHAGNSIPQLIGSLQSLLIGVLIARVSTVEEFGEFGVVFAFLIFLVALVRTVTSDVYLFHIDSSSRTRESASQSLSFGLGLAMLCALGSTLSVLVVPEYHYQVLWLALALPFFVLQDTVRNLLVGMARPMTASALDFVLFASIVVGLALLPRDIPPFYVQVFWAVCVGIIGLVGVAIVRPQLSLRKARAWWGPDNQLGRYLADFVLTNSLMPVAMSLTTAIAGLPAAAALRAAQMVLAPIQVLNRAAAVAFSLPSRRAAEAQNSGRVVRLSILLAGILVLASAAVSIVVWLLPYTALSAVFGDSAAVMLDVLPAAVVTLLAASLATGTGLAFRAFRRIRVTVNLKAVSLPISVIALCVGALNFGALGAQAGIAVGESVRAVLGWVLLFRKSRKETL